MDAVGTLSGILGNAGELSNAALPGALFGVLLATRSAGTWRALGALAAGSLLLHAAFAPALTTLGAAFLVGLLGATVSRMQSLPGARTRGMLLFATLAVALGAGRFALRALPSGPAEAAPLNTPAAQVEPSSDLGGLEVRALIARASLEAIQDAPLLGHGPGQFVAAFPPYRDQREIELSSHDRSVAAETEVEHAHSDLLLAAVEAGWLGGAALLLVFLHALRSIQRALSRGDDTEAGLALGLAGLIVASFFHAPFLHHPATSAVGFALIGATSGTINGAGLRGKRWFGVALAVVLCSHAPRALAIKRHGDALGELRAVEQDARAQLEVVDRMLTLCPDSVIALSRRARLLPTSARRAKNRSEPGKRS